jgi:N-methylhydantoinase A/oxoprolinase/acetone carboxylase beta subunit
VSRSDLRAGIDVGATSADAVVMDERGRLVAGAKVPARPLLRDSIDAALEAVLDRAPDGAAPLVRVALATRQVPQDLERRDALTRVGVLRLAAPLTGALPPLCGWPSDLRGAVSAGEAIVGGGAEFDGRAAAPLDVEAVLRFLRSVAADAGAIAVSGVFSPVAPEQEQAVTALVWRALGPDIAVTLSHEVGTLGLLERENATVLNAALAGPVRRVAAVLADALAAHGIAAEPSLAQNDGTTMSFEHAVRFPLLMMGGAAAAGLRGAAHLSGLEEATVVDVGGTHTEVGILVGGFPRDATPPIELSGVSADFRMPDLWRLAVGGETDGADHAAALGRALAAVDTLDLEPGRPHRAVVAVGGAADLAATALGADVMLPAHGEVAGAIGAAVAPVSGRADVVCTIDPRRLRVATHQVRREAVERAIHAGADPMLVKIVDVEPLPLGHLVEPAVRLRARAVGPPA